MRISSMRINPLGLKTNEYQTKKSNTVINYNSTDCLDLSAISFKGTKAAGAKKLKNALKALKKKKPTKSAKPKLVGMKKKTPKKSQKIESQESTYDSGNSEFFPRNETEDTDSRIDFLMQCLLN